MKSVMILISRLTRQNVENPKLIFHAIKKSQSKTHIVSRCVLWLEDENKSVQLEKNKKINCQFDLVHVPSNISLHGRWNLLKLLHKLLPVTHLKTLNVSKEGDLELSNSQRVNTFQLHKNYTEAKWCYVIFHSQIKYSVFASVCQSPDWLYNIYFQVPGL